MAFLLVACGALLVRIRFELMLTSRVEDCRGFMRGYKRLSGKNASLP
jgi:hypothetical protein